MLTINIRTANHKNDILCVIMDDAGLERMKAADPAQIVCRDMPVDLVNPTVIICYEPPSPEFERLVQRGDHRALIAFLQRGFQFRPDLGDNDNPPVSVGQQN